jgi:phytoene desaturase
MSRRVVVIGAGLGGLSAACHLAGRGYEVVVLESDERPGGCSGLYERHGYEFDTGPTVLTMPELVEHCFEGAGTDMSDLLEMVPVDPMYRACFADGTELRVWHDRDQMIDEIRAVCGTTEAERFFRFSRWLQELYRVEMPNFIERNYSSPLTLARPFGPLVRLARLGGFRRLAPTVAQFFEDERLRRLFTFQSLYAGVSPYEAMALYAVITYMDVVNGVFVPEGGMHALPVALAAAAEKAGAQFRYSTHVDRVLLERGSDGPVRGVRLASDEVVAADAVVCNAPVAAAYRSLLPGLRTPRRARRTHYSPSALLWHAGVRGALPARCAHHNVHFGHQWKDAFSALFDHGTRMPDPSFLVSVPTVTNPGMAPTGANVLYALEPVPNLDGRVDWTTERERARDALAGAAAAAGYPGDVEVEMLVDPSDWARRGMERGTPFALSHRFFQSGPFRPSNVDRRAPGLVFAGSSTVPGVGIPMVLVSGMLAAARVDELVGSS